MPNFIAKICLDILFHFDCLEGTKFMLLNKPIKGKEWRVLEVKLKKDNILTRLLLKQAIE